MELKTLNKYEKLSRKVKNYSLRKLWRLWNKFDIKATDEPKLIIVDREIKERYKKMENLLEKFL